jgi:hypothetical protein
VRMCNVQCCVGLCTVWLDFVMLMCVVCMYDLWFVVLFGICMYIS